MLSQKKTANAKFSKLSEEEQSQYQEEESESVREESNNEVLEAQVGDKESLSEEAQSESSRAAAAGGRVRPPAAARRKKPTSQLAGNEENSESEMHNEGEADNQSASQLRSADGQKKRKRQIAAGEESENSNVENWESDEGEVDNQSASQSQSKRGNAAVKESESEVASIGGANKSQTQNRERMGKSKRARLRWSEDYDDVGSNMMGEFPYSEEVLEPRPTDENEAESNISNEATKGDYDSFPGEAGSVDNEKHSLASSNLDQNGKTNLDWEEVNLEGHSLSSEFNDAVEYGDELGDASLLIGQEVNINRDLEAMREKLHNCTNALSTMQSVMERQDDGTYRVKRDSVSQNTLIGVFQAIPVLLEQLGEDSK